MRDRETARNDQWVFPEHAGAPGQIHGGRMMQWIAEAGTLAAARVAHGTVVLGAMDDIDFLHPVKVGRSCSPQVSWWGGPRSGRVGPRRT
jgi:acyl-CoA hydrolase